MVVVKIENESDAVLVQELARHQAGDKKGRNPDLVEARIPGLREGGCP